MVLKLPWAQKLMFWAFQKSNVQFFGNLWVKPFSGKVRQSILNYLNLILLIWSFLENSFGAILSSKTNVLTVWKEHFSFFCKHLSDEVETILWESEAKHSKLFRSNFRYMGHLTKWFWGNFQLKNEWSECLKRAFFTFLQTFEWRSWKHFLVKWGKALKLLKSRFGHRKLLRKWFWIYLDLKNECCECLNRVFFRFLQLFVWLSWKHFLGKLSEGF